MGKGSEPIKAFKGQAFVLLWGGKKTCNTPGENNHTAAAYVSEAKKQAEGYPKAFFCKPFGDFSWPQNLTDTSIAGVPDTDAWAENRSYF